jgi:hypothetical protein
MMVASDRFVLSALADRLVFGDTETFSRDDARELARLMPAATRWGFLSRLRPDVAIRANIPGQSTVASAAGVGTGRFDSGDREISFDSRGRRVVRAGQWKLLREGRTIEIEQVMADDSDDGRTARIVFRSGEPIRMCLLQTREFGIGRLVFEAGVFCRWKEPV